MMPEAVWRLSQVVLHLLLEGHWKEGTELPGSKQRLTYKLTGGASSRGWPSSRGRPTTSPTFLQRPVPERSACQFPGSPATWSTASAFQASRTTGEEEARQLSVPPPGGRLGAGARNLAVTLAAAAALWVWQPAALLWLHDHYLPLLTSAILFTFALSVYLYASSFLAGKLLSHQGSSRHWLYNFFMGRELNPRVGQLDLKEFCELYPGLSGACVVRACGIQPSEAQHCHQGSLDHHAHSQVFPDSERGCHRCLDLRGPNDDLVVQSALDQP